MKKTIQEIIDILADVSFPKYYFAVKADGDKWYLQGEYDEIGNCADSFQMCFDQRRASNAGAFSLQKPARFFASL